MPHGHAGDKPQSADWFCPAHGSQHREYAGTIGDDAHVVAPKGAEWEAEFEKYYAWVQGAENGPVRLKAIKDFITKLLSDRNNRDV